MKKTMILLIWCCLWLHTFSQVDDNRENEKPSKLTKEQKQAERMAKAEAVGINVDRMVENRRFVVEANYISDQTGRRVLVNSNLNFVRIDSSQISIQIAPLMGEGGANGMGGITADGSVLKWEVKRFGKDQQKYSIILSASFTRSGSYEVLLIIGRDSSVQATLSGIDTNKILFYGKLFSLRESKVYKGSGI